MQGNDGMRKLVALFLVLGIALLGGWLWVYESYVDIQDTVLRRFECGDCYGAMERLQAYQSSKASYAIYNIPLLDRFRLRLRYQEGVISGRLGDIGASESAFKDAARSDEPGVAANALYNLAFYAIDKDDLRSAKSLLSNSLRLRPDDVEAKVNLELVLKKIRARGLQSDVKQRKQEGKVVPGEQWRHDLQKREGEGVPGPRRSYL